MPYQIICFEPAGQGRSDALQQVIRRRLKDLEFVDDRDIIFLINTESDGRDRKFPAVAVYFGGVTPASDAVRASIRNLLDDSITVVPVVDDLTKFQTCVPEELYPINGLQFNPAAPNYETVTARLLEALRLLRETRRLFISYSRNESKAVAIQLYEALDARGFDVFLDTVSIRPGDPFQDVLRHRLADVDLVVLLHTAGFMERRWTVEELTTANQLNVGMLRLEWPEVTEKRQDPNLTDAEIANLRRLDEEAALSVPYVLTRGQFDSQGALIATVRDEVIERAEALRARALASRQTSITREFTRQARQAGFEVLPQPEHHMLLRKPEQTDRIAMPVVGAPSALAYEAFHTEIKKSPLAGSIPVYIVYDRRALLKKHLEHLTWLNDEVKSVHSIPVTDSYTKLSELR
jgi:hypothetical protein